MMKTLKEYNEEVSRVRAEKRKRQIEKYGDDRTRAGVLCDRCHENGKDVEMVYAGMTYPTYPPMSVLECPECGKQAGMRR